LRTYADVSNEPAAGRIVTDQIDLRFGAFLNLRVAKEFDLMILPRGCCPTYVGMVASSRFRYKFIFRPAFGMAKESSDAGGCHI
jgi:hypothetical protein